jgi:TMEM175 potassium channel family protein
VPTGRLEAFSDGVIAVIITIMVLELKAPEEVEWQALRQMLPTLLAYVLSFVFLGIYWNNHHHLLHVTERISGGVMWANLHLLFWLSLVPFVTAWMGEHEESPVPAAAYGGVLLMCGVAFTILVRAILAAPGGNPVLKAAVGRDFKGWLSLVLYAVGIIITTVDHRLSYGLYVAVALMWLIPDRRIEHELHGKAAGR